MQLLTTKPTNMQTFNGMDMDQRFARDDIEEPILRDRNLGSLIRGNQDEPDGSDGEEGEGQEEQEGM